MKWEWRMEMGMENAPHITKHMLPIPPVTTLGNSTAKPPVHAIRFSPILAEFGAIGKKRSLHANEIFTGGAE
jgi:hypothetical protein